MDLSKKLRERLSSKLAESPLDLSRKNVTTTDVGADTKPRHLLGLQNLAPTSRSAIPVAPSKQQSNVQSSFFSSLSASTALSSVPSTMIVQKVSPVWLQTYSTCGASAKESDRTARSCISAVDQKSSGVQSFPAACGSGHSDLVVNSVHSGGRIVSIVKPSTSVTDTQIQYDTLVVEPMVTNANHCMHTLLPSQQIHTNQKMSSFDAGRTDRGLPLAQVYPSRVVPSTVQNTTTETVPSPEMVPSPVHCKKEHVRNLPPDKTEQLESKCLNVCLTPLSSIMKTSSVDTDATALPVFMSPAKSSPDKSPASFPTTSAYVSPEMPILSPDVSSTSLVSHVASSTVSPESSSAKLTSSKTILPSADTSPKSYSDRDLNPDEYDSGQELFYTHMEWADNNVSDRTGCLPEVSVCNTEESTVKRPAFEIVGDCNRTLLSDISQPCYAVIAFDRSLLQDKSVDRNFILRTKYYRFFSRKVCAAGSDSDTVQSDKCSSPNVTCSASSQELRLPLSLSSALKSSSSSRSNLNAELNCKYGVSDKKVRGLRYQKTSATCDVFGDVYSSTLNNRPKGGDRVVHSDSSVRVKSELIDAASENKPDVHKRTFSQTRRKKTPAEVSASTSSCDEFVSSTDESYNSSIGERDVDSRRNVKTSGSAHTDYVAGDVVVACSKLTSAIHSKVSDTCNSGFGTSGRKSPQGKVPNAKQRKPGDANNNQGKTVDGLAASTPARSVWVVEPGVHHMRANAGSSKSDTALTYQLCRTTSSVSGATSKASNDSADGAASSLPSESNKSSSEQTCTTFRPNGQKFHSAEAVVTAAEAGKSDSSLAVTDAHCKAQKSILKQLESSEGYIAEKNATYSKSEDLFDDSSLLSREQRALRVSKNILQLETANLCQERYCHLVRTKTVHQFFVFSTWQHHLPPKSIVIIFRLHHV